MVSFATVAEFLHASSLPRLEARMLLQHVTGYTRAQLITHDKEPLNSNQIAQLHALYQRRLAGEPMAYVLGGREFYGRWFHTTPATLIPRPETEHLVEAALVRLPQHGKVWDLGTGSGAIALSIACERPDSQVLASDISAEALSVAQHNAQCLAVDNVCFALGSWFAVDKAVTPHSFDVLVSNPPYIEANDGHLQQGDLRFEPPHALTDFADGLTAIRQLAAGAALFLKPCAWLMIEHGYQQGAAVRAIFAQYGWQDIATLSDLAGLDRITLGRLAQ